MAKKKLPVELIVERKRETIVTLTSPGNIKTDIHPGITRIKDPRVIEHVHNSEINQGWLSNIEKKVHVVTEIWE